MSSNDTERSSSVTYNKDEEAKKLKKPKEKKVSFWKFFSFADGKDVGLMIMGSICAIANGMSQPILALLFGSMVDVFGNSDHHNIVRNVSKVCLKVLYLAIGNGVAACLQSLCWTITGERQVIRIQGSYLKAILRQEIAFFDTEMTTEKDNMVMPGDGVLIKDAICEKIGKTMQLLSAFFGGFVLAFVKGWLLSLVLATIIPVLLLAGLSTAIVISRMSIHTQLAFSEAKNIVQESVRAIRTVSSFNGENRAVEKYNKKLERACAFLIRQRLLAGLGFGMFSVTIFCSYGLAIWYGCKLIIKKGYTGGQIICILSAMIFSGMALNQISPCLSTLAATQATLRNMFENVLRRPKIDANDTKGIVMENIKGEIEFKDIYFKYPSRPGVEIFSGLSLHIPSERITALVGKSGSGKSTVINLLERFYDPDAGEILIDGINLKKLQLGWLRKQIGLVGQEPALFATTIKENIAYGKENATDDEIRTAIEFANAADFIDNLPKGWDTIVGDLGAQLSGGQKQRIAISRVILKNPRIFLLDEATSALDAKSEQTVRDALLRVMSNRTTLVITHCLSNVEDADNIAVIHHGKIVEQGTHAELTKSIDGMYNHLVCSQGTNHEGEVIGMDRHRNGDATGSKFESHISFAERRLCISRHSNLEIESERTIRFESDGKNDVKHGNVNIKQLASLCKQELPTLFLGSIAATLHGLAFPIFGYLFATAIKTFYEPHSKLQKDSRFWALVYVVLGNVTMLAISAQNYFFGVASGKLIKKFCSLSFKKIIHQEGSWFDDPANSSGAVGARLSANSLAMQSLLGSGLSLMVQNSAASLAGLLIAFTVNRILAAIVLALSAIVVLLNYIQTKCLGKFATDAKVLLEEQSQVASDAIGSMKTVASFCAESKVLDLYQRKSVATMKYRFKLGYIGGIVIGISRCTFYIANASCFFVGAILVQHQKATALEVIKVYLALTISAIGVVEASGTAVHTKRASGLATSVFEILDSKPKIDSSICEGLTLEKLEGDIEFRNVSFKYPSRPNVRVLKDLCLRVPSGKTVVLVGESGNGKSTIINLLERFYDVDSGCILLDGIEIQKFNLCWLRQQIGLVSQEPILFKGTIHDNIAYGSQGDVGRDEIIAAAETANAHNFIKSLPQGYDTLVGDRGVQLSGGQKQRIAIARAIMKDPKIFLLDEATSALDAESENVVQEALNRVTINKTTVVVTHRLSSIRESDIVAFLRNGVIVEQGRHHELMKIPDGAYAAMVDHYMNRPM